MTFSEHKGTCKTSPPTYKTSSSVDTQIDGLSWIGASWLRSQQLAEEDYKQWLPK